MPIQELKLVIRNTENIGFLSQEDLVRITEILTALVSSGGLTGVKGGKTSIHFDGEGNFMGIELAYWPFRRRRKE